ncbi:MAG: ATP-dependent DNA helicase, partial [Acidobacteriota bacterium]
CSAGKVVWLRLQTPAQGQEEKRKGPAIRSTPVTFVDRANLAHWRRYSPPPTSDQIRFSANAQAVVNLLREWGASFFQELLEGTGLLKSQLESALGELVAQGVVTADSFQGLRTLVTPQQSRHRHRRQHIHNHQLAAAGRWSLARPIKHKDNSDRFEHAEHIARILLRRYGVVFRKLLERESGLPPWRDLLYIYRRLEARGEIRGGRFIQSFAGEQYALPEAVVKLRQVRNQTKEGDLIAISAADPLNLTGLITPGNRVPVQQINRILYRDGVPIAASSGGQISFLEPIESTEEWHLRKTLVRKKWLPVQPNNLRKEPEYAKSE